jgi:hypothetical protein
LVLEFLLRLIIFFLVLLFYNKLYINNCFYQFSWVFIVGILVSSLLW